VLQSYCHNQNVTVLDQSLKRYRFKVKKQISTQVMRQIRRAYKQLAESFPAKKYSEAPQKISVQNCKRRGAVELGHRSSF
jgi:hypothetical protein